MPRDNFHNQKKIILHIGCEKTGSTSIQRFLFKNRKVLLKTHGILYPISLTSPYSHSRGNHTRLGIYTCDENKKLAKRLSKRVNLDKFREEIEKKFSREIENTSFNMLLLSNEWLHRVRNPQEFLRLKTFLGKVSDEIEIVLYIRRQDKLALSRYSTSIKAGNFKPFRFPNPHKRQGRLPYLYDFYSIYENWVNFFGRGNVKIRIFDPEKLTGQDVVRDFISFLDIPSNGFTFIPPKNTSLTDSGIRIMRQMNYISRRFRMPTFVRKPLIQIFSLIFSGKPHLSSKNQCASFLSRFSESNKRLSDQYLKDCAKRLEL